MFVLFPLPLVSPSSPALHISPPDGAFIVEDSPTSPPPFTYDTDLTLLFGDIYHASDYNVTSGLLGAPFAWPNDPQALTVNGNAFGECNESTSTGSCVYGCHTEVVDVEPGKVYRVRAIGVTALSFLCALISFPFSCSSTHPG